MVDEGEIKFSEQTGKPTAQVNQSQNGDQKKFIDELVKKLQTEPTSEQSEEKKINELVTKTSRVLLKVSGLFPFDFFPDEITIDENKINIVRRGLIDENTYSIPIKDLGDVAVLDSLIFASLTIVDNRTKDEPIKLQFLDPDDAKKSYNIIQGLILGREQKIDWAKIKTEELVKKVEELGQVKV